MKVTEANMVGKLRAGASRFFGLAALVLACPPVHAQQNEPADLAMNQISAGDADGARQMLAQAAENAIQTGSGDAYLSSLVRILAGAQLDGQLGSGLTFAQAAFATVANTQLATATDFIEFTNYRARLCAIVGDIDCIEQSATAAFFRMQGPTGDYERSEEREATQWRAVAHFIRGERAPAEVLLNVLVSGTGKANPISLAVEIEGLANGASVAPQIRHALLREAIVVVQKDKSRDRYALENRITGNLGVSFQNSGMLVEAESAYREAWRISEREFDQDSVGAISDSLALAGLLASQGRWEEALPLYRRNWEIADSYRDWTLDIAEELGGWIFALIATGQVDEADQLTERMLREVRATKNLERDTLSQYLNLRAIVLIERGQLAAAEPLLTEAVEANSQNDLSGGSTLITNLAAVLEAQDRFAEAEPLRRKAYEAVRKNVVFSPFGSQRIDVGVMLAGNLSSQGKSAEAEALLEELMALARERADPAGYGVRTVALTQAQHFLARDDAGSAVGPARLALSLSAEALNLLGLGTGEGTYLTVARQQRAAALLFIEARLAQGALDEQAMDELFLAGQRAHANSAAFAMALNAARLLARKAGASETVEQWQDAQATIVALDQRIAAMGQLGEAGAISRRPLLDERDAARRLLQDREQALLVRFPRFFDLARPGPMRLADVRALLAPDEALVLLVPGSGGRNAFGGMVLATTAEGAHAARIGITSDQLTDLAAQLHEGLAGDGAGFTAAEDFDAPTVLYDRTAALQVYRALFGDTQIKQLLADRPNWTLAPQQILMGVSFDALVTADPPGGRDGGADPASLRATAWLGIERALAITPSVAGLVLARSQEGIPTRATEPFFGLGDPAFKGKPDAPVTIPEQMRDRSLATTTRAPNIGPQYFRGPVADLTALARLQRLPGTAIELATLARMLGAPDGALLTQLDATEAALRASDASGQLESARLVVLATHGLVGGGMMGAPASEPALALTPPPGVAQDELRPENDGLLTAMEAAGLTIAAEWVILSACNTSAADGRDPDGLSGLARGFFYAGAQALLVSHFPVSDKATPLLTAAAVASRSEGGMSRAVAMQAARRKLLVDTAFDGEGMSLSHPKAWAGLALVDPGSK